MTKEDVVKKALIAVIEKLQPELNRKFDIRKIIAPGGTRGLLRDELKKKLLPEDRKIVSSIFADLKKEKILYHIAGTFWTRLK